jgi:hypothetical protein
MGNELRGEECDDFAHILLSIGRGGTAAIVGNELRGGNYDDFAHFLLRISGGGRGGGA